ncbi:MAG: type II toxin-antitoxin system PemK/MazF family toxin [Parcubacteria group bacterium]
MKKDFDKWNKRKQQLHNSGSKVYAHPREVWWCSFGVNIGAETDGGDKNFERPALILRVYNKETMLALPITGKAKNDQFHYKITITSKKSNTKEIETKDVWIKLTQARVVSNKRLLRKVDMISEEEFEKIGLSFRRFI